MRSDDLPFEHPWQQGPIAEYADVIVGGTPSTEIPGFWGGEIAWMASGDVHRGHVFDVPGRISQRGLAASNATVVAPKAVAMALAGQGKTRGTVALTHVPICTNQSVALIKPRDARLDAEFLFQSLIPRYEEMRSRSAGGGRAGLTKAIIEKTPIQVPTRGEQRSIAEVLSTVDEIIEQTEGLIAKTHQTKAGLMHDLFTRGVTPDGQLRPPRDEAPQLYKESVLGWIPKEWEAGPLDRVALRGSGHTPNRSHPEYWNGGVKWVSLADSWRLDRVHISETDHEISHLGIENSSAVLHPPGIVLLSRDAGVGKSAITTREMAVSQHFMCWKCGPRLNNYFLYYWLQFRKWEFENIATGSTIPTIGLRFFERYRMSIPSHVAEQEQIGDSLFAADEETFALEEDLRKLRDLKAGLMHDLLTGRVRVPVAEMQKVAANGSAP